MSDKNRIHLRPLEASDAPNIVRWRNSDAVRRNLLTQNILTEEQHLSYYHSVVMKGLCRQFIIVWDETPPMDIGTVFLKNIDLQSKQAEFGIFIGEPNGRSRNLSYKATEEILRIAFQEIGLNHVYLTVAGDNTPAIKTYMKCGFNELGRDKKSFPRDGYYVDLIHMDLLKEQWERNHGE